MKFNFFQPSLRIGSVCELTPPKLETLELKNLLLDADSTLKRYRAEMPEPDICEWLEQMKTHRIGLCLVSNGKGFRIRRFAENIALPVIPAALKPLPRGCNEAVRLMNFDKKTTAMVGDQVFADVLAGKWAGLFTILVEPVHPEEEHWFTRIKRPFEKIVLR
ncbi:MAG: YqeG family HAD IIIA-type phosphatase [Planctomycetaceae bacterium]|jgi:HAD superfamily phosphatase (TIGR01668 family)|nr:YqeG family HAD IIIA-type phosphatase [Planctomycetaceae bacterium]